MRLSARFLARRRWPEAALVLVLLLLAVFSGPLLRSVAILLLGGVLAFAIRRRLSDVLRAAVIFVATILLSVALTLVVDLGPALRGLAERAGGQQIDRPLHIGRLGIHLASGRFVVEDLVIEGKRPGDLPFFKARTISVSVPWWRVFRTRQVLIESVEMSDWAMLVERWPEGKGHNFIRIPSRRRRQGEPLVRTSLRYVHAGRGNFTYIDYGTWRTTAANLDIVVDHSSGRYLGKGSASGGSVKIRDYAAMRTDMRFTFEIKGGAVELDKIDMYTDGSHSLIEGRVDLGRWPEQRYRVKSQVDLARMREIYFADAGWRSRGDARFDGTFELFRSGGHRLAGEFASDLAWVNEFAFPGLRGSLLWEPRRFEVRRAAAGFMGGGARFEYTMAPLGLPTSALYLFDAEYSDVDLGQLSDVLGTSGLRLEGRATGRNTLEWPSGGWALRRGEGEVNVSPPAGTAVLAREEMEYEAAIHDEALPAGPEPHYSYTRRPTPIGGRIVYRFDRDWVDIAPSQVSTERTYVEFEGRSAYTEQARYPFYARSADWQESDRVLAAVLTAFGSPAGVVAIGGHGDFRGVMIGAFRAPRIEGSFSGEGLRAWNVVWGRGKGDVVVENGYVNVTGGVMSDGNSEIQAEGLFSLGYPRRDGGEELNARVTIKDRPLRDLRHAFELDDWPLEGLLSGEFHLYGAYTRPFGFGQVRVTQGSGWGEPFEFAASPMRFEGTGVRLEGARITKATGAITAGFHVLWEGRYSFSADGRRIPVESVAKVRNQQAPLSGLLNFRASGAGEFLSPRYDVSVGIDDLFAGDEGIGQVKAQLSVREKLLTITQFEAASPRLAVSGAGRVEMTDTGDAEMTLRFNDTSLDPYVRAYEPRLSPFTRAVASGSIRVIGQLYNPERLSVNANLDSLELRLFDYRLRNDEPVRLAFDSKVVRVERLKLVGVDTRLEVSGDVDLNRDRIDVKAVGDANLAVLQGFFRDIRASGRAELSAGIQGPVAKPVFSGSATITGGRVRYFGLPHSIQAINGRVTFSTDGIEMEGVTAQVANGRVRFGGGIELSGYAPGQLSLTAVGENMDLRYPEGVRSVIDADLQLVGTFASPTLQGTVTVRSAVWRKRIDISPGLFELIAGRAGDAAGGGGQQAGTLPLRFDLKIVAPSSLRIDNNLAQVVASGDLTLRGDFNHPVLLGTAELERGQALFEGKRYQLSGRIDFTNPKRIEPFIDVSAETRVRAPGQTYVVDLRLTGTMRNLQPPQLSSDPPLPPVEILTLLFGDPTRADVQDAELRSLQRTQTQGSLGYSRLEQAVVGTLSGDVTRAVEQAFRLDTFQITPSLFDPYQRVSPTARLTVGKRISDKVYLTFSRSLNTPGGDQVLLVEYDQNERLSWVFSRNEDATYALDVRVRHVF